MGANGQNLGTADVELVDWLGLDGATLHGGIELTANQEGRMTKV